MRPSNSLHASQYGKYSEEIAANYLEKSGWIILAKNFRIRGGEIDLIALDGKTMVFVEVRARSARAWQESVLESMHWRKRRSLNTAARRFFHESKLGYKIQELRFDFISIGGHRIESHIKDWQ